MIADHWLDWYPKLLVRAKYLSGRRFNPVDAEDLVSQAVEKALRAEQRGVDVQYGYLYVSLGTLAIDRARKHYEHQLFDSDYLGTPDQTEQDAMARVHAEWALNQLRPNERAVAELIGVGTPRVETAEQLGVTDEVVKNTIKRVRNKLRKRDGYGRMD